MRSCHQTRCHQLDEDSRKATRVWQSDHLNAVSVEWDEAQPKLPKHGSADPPRFRIEACTVSWVGVSEERRDLAVDAADG